MLGCFPSVTSCLLYGYIRKASVSVILLLKLVVSLRHPTQSLLAQINPYYYRPARSLSSQLRDP